MLHLRISCITPSPALAGLFMLVSHTPTVPTRGDRQDAVILYALFGVSF